MRSRLLRASGPTLARSSTSHAESESGSRVALWTRPFHWGDVDRSARSPNSRSAAHGASSEAVRSMTPVSRLVGRLTSPLAAEGSREERASRFEQAVEIVGLIERRLAPERLGLGLGRVVDLRGCGDHRLGVELQLLRIVA